MENCIFCKIVRGEIPSYKVYEDEYALAFLDISQNTPGHTLLIPKKHIEDIYGYSSEDSQHVLTLIPKIARAVRDATNAKGLNILNNNGEMAGQSVHHSHFHFIPRYNSEDLILEFNDNTGKATPEELSEIAQKIKNNLK